MFFMYASGSWRIVDSIRDLNFRTLLMIIGSHTAVVVKRDVAVMALRSYGGTYYIGTS